MAERMTEAKANRLVKMGEREVLKGKIAKMRTREVTAKTKAQRMKLRGERAVLELQRDSIRLRKRRSKRKPKGFLEYVGSLIE